MTDNRKTIAVVISFYGYSPYLKDFLDSLAGQTLQDFRLLYRFDGTTTEAVRTLVARYNFAEPIGDERHCGIPGTYWELLLHASGYPYLMFADQDDLWHPDKIEKSLAAIREMEKQYGKEMPLLVHSDLTVINADGKELSPSFFRYQSLNFRCSTLKDLMIQNNVTGCTMIFNRALAGYLQTPVPAICHDWYMALIASAFGKIGFIEEALIDYRQHAGNYFGAVPVRKMIFAKLFFRKDLHARVVMTQKQALLFLEEFRSRITPEQKNILEEWGKKLPEVSYWKKIVIVFRFHFRKNDWLRTIGMWWAL